MRIVRLVVSRTVFAAVWVGSAAIISAASATPATSNHAAPAGAVLERLGSNSIVDGLKTGDVLVSWSRSANPPANPKPEQGVIRSPFDVTEVEIEQAPRGPLTLTIRRDGRLSTVSMPTGHWDLVCGPVLGEDAARAWAAARAEANKQEFGTASKALVSLAERAEKSHNTENAAWLLASAADVASRAGNQPVESKALYQRAIDVARASGAWKMESQNWWRLAQFQALSRNFPEAVNSLSRGLDLRTVHEGDTLFVEMLRAVAATVEFESGHLDRAVELNRQVLSARERMAPDSLPVAAALNNLSTTLGRQGRYEESQKFLTRAIAIEEAQGRDGPAYVTLLSNQAASSAERGDLLKAERIGRKALAIQEKRGPRDIETAWVLLNLGSVSGARGDLAEAGVLTGRGLAIVQEKEPGSEDEGVVLMNLGIFAQMRGDTASADSYLQAALQVLRKAESWEALPRVYVNLSTVASDRGDLQRAEEYSRQSLKMLVERAPNSVPHAMALASLAKVVAREGRSAEARDLYAQVFAILAAAAPGSLELASAYSALGEIALEEGDFPEADRNFQAALLIGRHLGPDSPTTAEIVHDLGLLERRKGNLPKARTFFLEALDILERQNGKIGGDQGTDPGFLAKYRDFYSDCIDVLVEMGTPADAFAVLERSRSRSLVELMAERDIAWGREIPEPLDRERRRLDTDYEQAQSQIRSLSPKTDSEQIDALLGNLNELRRQKQELADQIRKDSPRYAALQYPKSLDLAGTRAALDPGTLLLSYSVGKKKVVLFAVEPASARGTGLTTYSLAGDERQLREGVEAYRNLINFRDHGSDSAEKLARRARSLFDILLKPAEPLIARYDRILVISDGPLHTLPFAALARERNGGRSQYFAEWKPVHTAVSATVYAELKKSRRSPAARPTIEIAAFGDPRYPKSPEGKGVLVGRGGEEVVETPSLDSEFEEVGDAQLRAVLRSGFRLNALPASRNEVDQIASLYAPRAVTYLGSEATEEKAKAIGRDIPLIHFACHAILNERFPLDSALAFSIPETPSEGRDNGLLQAWEIFETVRIDADLVTLSACESGLGKETGGEGLIGLARAFQYAGAHSILASLWKVEDKSTAELMKRFYAYLKSGKTKDEALRQAQVDMIRSSNFSEPVHWAAFELIGDWK